MSPLFTLLGKLLVNNNALTTSPSCCCSCKCPSAPYQDFCSCLSINISFNSTSVAVKLGGFPSSTGTKQIPSQSNGDIPSSTLEYYCTEDGPEGRKGWVFTYTMSDRSETWGLFVGETLGIIQDIKNVNGKCCPQYGPCPSPNGWGMTPDIVLEDTPMINLSFYSTCTACEDTKCLPKTWQLYDTINQKVLDYGDVVSLDPGNMYATDYILENLGNEFIPWGYYSKNFHVELRVYCEDDLFGERLWGTDVEIGSCGDNRYPTYNYDAPWTRKICTVPPNLDPCLYDDGYIVEINMNPGGKTRSGCVQTYKGLVTNNYDYSNIFNWEEGSYDIGLPTSSCDVEIRANCLENGAGTATCKNLTMTSSNNGGLLGIKITSNGRVLVTGGAHVIDEKYNSVCEDLPVGRGHIVCNNTGSVSKTTLSDNVEYEYDGDIIVDGNSFLSGTLEYIGTNKVAASFHASTITDNATIIGGEHIYLRRTHISAAAGGLQIAEPVYSGKWIFNTNSRNYGGIITTPEYVRFFNASSNEYNTGTITTTAPVRFYDDSYNGNCAIGEAIVTHDAEFYNSAVNAGRVKGNAIFYNTSFNDTCGVIDGNAEFYDSSYFKGGTIVGSVDLYNTAYVDGTLTNDDIEFWNDSYVKSGTINSNSIVYFHDNSYAKNCTINADCNFTGEGSSYINNVVIDGNLTMHGNTLGASKVRGTNTISENATIGTTIGLVIYGVLFDQGSTTTISGTLDLYGWVNEGATVNVVGKITYYKGFNNGTINCSNSDVDMIQANSYGSSATLPASISVVSGKRVKFFGGNGNGTYNGNVGNSNGQITGNTEFENGAWNGGIINGNAKFTDSYNYYSVMGNAEFYGASINYISVSGHAIFKDTSKIGLSTFTSSVGSADFYDQSRNDGNLGGIGGIGGSQISNLVFYAGTSNYGTISNYNQLTFSGGTNENGATTNGNASFINGKNYGTVNGDANFDSSSCDSGTVTGTITGNPPAC